jgi:nitrogen fixation protein NifB
MQDRLGDGAKLMKHCRQCRADAVGLLGEDRGAEFTLDKLGATAVFDPGAREIYLSVVERERADRQCAKELAEMALNDVCAETPLLVAVTTKGGGRINLHFGHATEFQIYEVDSRGARFVGHRRADAYCRGGQGEEDVLDGILKTLDGVSSVLCAKIGNAPRQKLEAAGIAASDQYAFEYIEASAIAWYLDRHRSGIVAQTA